jgi:hypothetical protein
METLSDIYHLDLPAWALGPFPVSTPTRFLASGSGTQNHFRLVKT